MSQYPFQKYNSFSTVERLDGESSLTTPPSQTSPLPPVPTSTPIIHKLSGTHDFSSQVPDEVKQKRLNMAEEVAGKFLGPMPIQSFFDEFMHVSGEIPAFPDAERLFSAIPKCKNEAQITVLIVWY